MGKRNNVRNAFIIANNSRTAANRTHGVTCYHPNCNEFDPNVRMGKAWYCESHGGANNIARANAKDDKFANGIPGAEKKVTSTVIQPKAKVSKPKKSERQKMLDSLGLTEADLAALRG